MTRRVRIGLALLIALVLAPALLLQGLANDPLRDTLAIPLGSVRSWNGFRMAQLSLGYMTSSEQGANLRMSVQPEGVTLARQAFAREPLAANALFVLAVWKRSQGDIAAMQAIVNDALKLDKRNRNIGALQLEQAALSGRVSKTFSIIDRMAITHPDLTGQFVKPLIASLADGESIPVLARALRRNPVWARAFWKQVPDKPAILANFYALRQMAGNGATPASDGALLQRLVSDGLYDRAFSFWKTIGGKADNASDYVPDTSFPPFGWDLTSNAERAMTAHGNGVFNVYTQGGTGGELARQLLQLQPGKYQFSTTVSPRSSAANVQVVLQCVNAKDALVRPQALDKAASWTVDSVSCPAWWLILQSDAYDDSAPLQATLSAMQFRPAS